MSARCITGTAFEISGDVQGSGTDLKLFAEAPDGEPVGPDVPMTAGFGFIYQGDIGALPQPQFIELLLTSTDEVDVYDHDLPTIDWSQCDTAEPEPGEPDTGEPEPSEPEPSEPETGEPETGDADADADERPMLPATGPDSSTWMALSAGLALLSGTAMLAATRRRT